MSRRILDRQLYTSDGKPVLLVVPCTKCGIGKPFDEFGLRVMSNGEVRNIPQCVTCRGQAAQVDAMPPGGPELPTVDLPSAIAEAQAAIAARGAK